MRRFSIGIFLFVLVGVSAFFALNLWEIPEVFAGVLDNVSGWAWSSTIGWISFNCTDPATCGGVDYGVTAELDAAQADYGNLKGYAWSENIGWIWFDPPGGYPNGNDPSYSACVDLAGAGEACDGPDDFLVHGWARACAGAADPVGCSGGANPNAGGWDGWILLRNNPLLLSPIGHWKLDEVSGNIAPDSSGNGNNGTLQGGPIWLPFGGQVDGALAFDGNNDYVDVGNAGTTSLQYPMSITAWINIDAFGQNRPILSRDGTGSNRQFEFRVDTAPALEFTVYPQCGSSGQEGFNSTAFSAGDLNKWIFAGVTVSSSGAVQLYTDGQPNGSGQINNLTICGTSQATFIGAARRNSNWRFDGIIDDVQLYDRALSASEILASYNNALGGYGVSVDPATGDMSGWAWGGPVAGWISFNSATGGGSAHAVNLNVGAAPEAKILCNAGPCSDPTVLWFRGAQYTNSPDLVLSHDASLAPGGVSQMTWDIFKTAPGDYNPTPDLSCLPAGACVYAFGPPILPAGSYNIDLTLTDSFGRLAVPEPPNPLAIEVKQDIEIAVQCALDDGFGAPGTFVNCLSLVVPPDTPVWFRGHVETLSEDASYVDTWKWEFDLASTPTASPATMDFPPEIQDPPGPMICPYGMGSGATPDCEVGPVEYETAGRKKFSLTAKDDQGRDQDFVGEINITALPPNWREITPF